MMKATSPDQSGTVDRMIGKRIRVKRLLIGMTQEKLGQQLSVTLQQIQKYEKGINRVSAARLFEISKIFSVDLNYFFGDDETIGAAASQDYLLLDNEDAISLLRAYSDLKNAASRQTLVKIAHCIAELDKSMVKPAAAAGSRKKGKLAR